MKLQTIVLAMAAVLVVLQAWLVPSSVAGGASPSDYFTPPPTVVSITNNLEGHQILEVHCKDAHHDYGTHWVPYGQTYQFPFLAFEFTDYYCGFTFSGALHWFDIYRGKRDMYKCREDCRWSITEGGPCRLEPSFCFPWNHDATLP